MVIWHYESRTFLIGEVAAAEGDSVTWVCWEVALYNSTNILVKTELTWIDADIYAVS